MTTTDALWLESVGSAPEPLPADDEPLPMGAHDRALEWLSMKLGLCGFGRDNNWSIRFANIWFAPNGCACCTVIRAYCGGFVSGGLAALALVAAVYLWRI